MITTNRYAGNTSLSVHDSDGKALEWEPSAPSSGKYICVDAYGSVSTGTGWVTEGSSSSIGVVRYFKIEGGGPTIYTNEEKTTTTNELQIYLDENGNLVFNT